MHLPKRWWIGLPILAGLAYFATDDLTPRLEADLAARVARRLAEAPNAVDAPHISVVGRDVTISGVALSPEYKDRVFAMLGPEAGARTLSDATQAVGVAKPFVLKLARQGGKVTISGAMPVADLRENLRGALAAMGFEVQDAAAFAQGAPREIAALATFAASRLAELDPADAVITDAALAVTGEARSAADYDKALAALKSAPVAGATLSADIAPPRVSPYVFSITRNDNVIALSGHLPSEEIRKKVVAMAADAGAGVAVSDATHLGSGAPAGDFGAALAFAVAELGKLSQGKIALVDGKLTIEGQGRDNIEPAALENDAKARLPQGFELARLDVAAGPVSPYLFGAERRGGEVTLTGYAPDEATRARMVEAARRRFFDAAVVDRLSVAKGAPQNFAEAVDRSIGALARLAEGRLAIDGGKVNLAGVARYETARADIARSLTDELPRNFRGDASISARTVGSTLDPDRCRNAVSTVAGKGRIAFNNDDVTVTPDSAPVLDALVATLLRCEGLAVEVGGHTDALGIAEVNRDRSKRRAQAVADALVRAGADAFKVTAVGYGGERPIASNDSEEERAKNVRIEFTIK